MRDAIFGIHSMLIGGERMRFLWVVTLGVLSAILDVGSLALLKVMFSGSQDSTGSIFTNYHNWLSELFGPWFLFVAVGYFVFATFTGVLSLSSAANFSSRIVSRFSNQIVDNVFKLRFEEALKLDKVQLVHTVSTEAQRLIEKCIYQTIIVANRIWAVALISIVSMFFLPVKFLVILGVIFIFYIGLYRLVSRFLISNSLQISIGNEHRLNLLEAYFGDLEESIVKRRGLVQGPKFANLTSSVNSAIAKNAILGSSPRYLVDLSFFVLLAAASIGSGATGSLVEGSAVILLAVALKVVPYCQQIYSGLAHLKGNMSCWSSFSNYLALDSIADIDESSKFRAHAPRFEESLNYRGSEIVAGGTTVLRELNFEIFKGSKVLIKGDSGSGKTTLLRSLAGLFPDKIKIFVDGVRVHSENDEEWSKQVAYVSQKGRPYGSNLGEIFFENDVDFDLKRLMEMAEVLEVRDLIVNDHSDPSKESGLCVPLDSWSFGQVQRLKLIKALLASPSILILDESISGLHSGILLPIRRLIDSQEIPFIFEVAHERSLFVNYDKVINLRNGSVTVIDLD